MENVVCYISMRFLHSIRHYSQKDWCPYSFTRVTSTGNDRMCARVRKREEILDRSVQKLSKCFAPFLGGKPNQWQKYYVQMNFSSIVHKCVHIVWWCRSLRVLTFYRVVLSSSQCTWGVQNEWAHLLFAFWVVSWAFNRHRRLNRMCGCVCVCAVLHIFFPFPSPSLARIRKIFCSFYWMLHLCCEFISAFYRKKVRKMFDFMLNNRPD